MENRNKVSWSLENLIEAVKTSNSYTEILIKVGAKFSNQAVVKRYIEGLGLDVSHIDIWAKRPNPFKKKDLKDVLIENSIYRHTSGLRDRLIKEGILKNKCSDCGIGNKYNNKVITLQLDHINGVKTDNRIENLRILCPNCHSQSSTFAGRNNSWIKKGKAKRICVLCSGKVSRRGSKYCKPCYSKEYSRNMDKRWPEKQELLKEVQLLGATKTAAKYKTKKQDLLKRLKRYGYDPTPFMERGK